MSGCPQFLEINPNHEADIAETTEKKEQELTRVFSNPLMNARSDGGTVGISVNSNVVSEEILMEDEVSFLHCFTHMSANY